LKYIIISIVFLAALSSANEENIEQVIVFDPMQMMEIESLTQENRALRLENDALKLKISQSKQNDQENLERKNRETVLFNTINNLNARVQTLKSKNNELLAHNKVLKRENSELKKRVAHLDKSLLISKKKLKHAFEKLTEQERTLAIEKIQKSVTLDKTSQYIQPTSVVEVHDLHSVSPELESKYNNYRQRYLIKNNMYRVPVYRLNVRLTSSSASTITLTLRYGEMVTFDEIYKSSKDGKTFYRLHTKSGWIYVTDLTTLDVQKNLEEKYNEQ
jgi:regulator of replication initiation timing